MVFYNVLFCRSCSVPSHNTIVRNSGFAALEQWRQNCALYRVLAVFEDWINYIHLVVWFRANDCFYGPTSIVISRRDVHLTPNVRLCKFVAQQALILETKAATLKTTSDYFTL
jgi:hypothetical protein